MTGTLFNLDDYQTPHIVHDPYWDELEKTSISDCSGKDDREKWPVLPFPETPEEVTVLDCSGKIEENAQTTLFYDDTQEPPDPDEFSIRADYLKAWIEWEKKFPEQVTPPRLYNSFKKTYKGCEAWFYLDEKTDDGYLIDFYIDHPVDGQTIRDDFKGTYPTPTHAELEFIEYVDGVREWPDIEEFMEFDDGEFTEDLPKTEGWHFEEGQVYWHQRRRTTAKIIKLFKTVPKAEVYFGDAYQIGEFKPEKINLSELSPLPEQILPTCETTTEPEPEPINSENCQPVTTLPEQADVVLEKPAINQWVERYYVMRSGKKYWYDRYCYYQKKIKHIHIPGSDGLKERVENAIAQHKLPSEIEKLIKSA